MRNSFEERISDLLEILGAKPTDVFVGLSRFGELVAFSRDRPTRRLEIDKATANVLLGRGASWAL